MLAQLMEKFIKLLMREIAGFGVKFLIIQLQPWLLVQRPLTRFLRVLVKRLTEPMVLAFIFPIIVAIPGKLVMKVFLSQAIRLLSLIPLVSILRFTLLIVVLLRQARYLLSQEVRYIS